MAVIVPATADMDDETFKKHANRRHLSDYQMPFGSLAGDKVDSVLASARMAHRYWHMAHPEQYDHEHLEEK